MNNFGEYIIVDEFLKRHNDANPENPLTREHALEISRNNRLCKTCEMEEVWKAAMTNLCFSCTTGEADASNDWEVEE